MVSNITGGETEPLFTAKILNKYNVPFFRCKETGFIQTEYPYWLQEAYSSAITKLDLGLVMRNENLVKVAVPLFFNHFNHNHLFLDFAGGYGLFTRMMRDRGFDFYHTDIYCKNIFAELHDLSGLPANTKFEAVTAFEVVEHLVNPIKEIEEILSHSDNLFFTTELIPQPLSTDWWYFSFETGQHISFYTTDALQYIAHKFERHFYSDGKWLHLFTKNKLKQNPFDVKQPVREQFLVRKMRKYLRRHDEKINPRVNKESLLGKDTDEAKKRLNA